MSVCDGNGQQVQQPPQQQTAHQQQQSTQSIADYLAQLLKDRKQLAAFPNVFNHLERLLDEEIARVRASLFQINGVKKEPLMLPDPEGAPVQLNEKVYVPVREHPDFNFVGRILGPRGMTAKQLEQETGCKIMVRGKGSMRDKKKEDTNRGKPNWEHLSDDLHVLITVEDTENRACVKLAQAVAEVKKLLVPQAEGEDELKKRQLMELAIINGTYRDTSAKSVAAVCEEEWRRVVAASAENRLLATPLQGLAQPIRAQTAAPMGAPLILSQRMTVPTTTSILSGQGAPTGFENPMIFAPYGDYANYAALTGNPLLTEYADHSVRGSGSASFTSVFFQTLLYLLCGKRLRSTLSASNNNNNSNTNNTSNSGSGIKNNSPSAAPRAPDWKSPTAQDVQDAPTTSTGRTGSEHSQEESIRPPTPPA